MDSLNIPEILKGQNGNFRERKREKTGSPKECIFNGDSYRSKYSCGFRRFPAIPEVSRFGIVRVFPRFPPPLYKGGTAGTGTGKKTGGMP